MQTCLHLPQKQGVFFRKSYFEKCYPGKTVHGGVGEWEWAVEQVLMQSLKYVLIKCRGRTRMLSTVYAHVAGHLQKCHLSLFYGWENSIAEWQNKDPHDHAGHKLSRFGYRFVLALAAGLCYLVRAGTAANCCLPSWPPALGLTLSLFPSS